MKLWWQVVVGVVYNPILDELYTAMRGKGAFLNGEPIRVSDCPDLGSALIITEIGVTRDDATLSALFGRISAVVKGVRVFCMCFMEVQRTRYVIVTDYTQVCADDRHLHRNLHIVPVIATGCFVCRDTATACN